MADEPENIVLVYLRRLDTAQQEIGEDLRELKHRLPSLETGQASIRRDVADLAETDAQVPAAMDQLRDSIDRINKRLDLVELAPPS